MKKLMLTCSLIAAASVISFAQTTQQSTHPGAVATTQNKMAPHEQSIEVIAEKRTKADQKQFGLSDAQYKDIYEVELDYAKHEQQAKANNVAPGSGQYMQMEIIKDARFKNTLNADQYAKYQATKPKTANRPATMGN